MEKMLTWCDAHAFSFQDDSFDVVLAVSVWEHLARPWIGAQELERILAPGGIAFIATHQTFPLHGYPTDFTRWSTQGLSALFESAGLTTTNCSYLFPAKIVPPKEVVRWNTAAKAYLNVEGIFQKPRTHKSISGK